MTFPGYETTSIAIVNSIGCLTAFVPQGLPTCVALSFTVIARHVAKRQVLVKNLGTAETLGCMSVLYSDKTGTLTAGKMLVQNITFLDHYCSVKVLLQEALPNHQAQLTSPLSKSSIRLLDCATQQISTLL